MGDEDNDLEKWRKEQGIPDEEFQRMHSPELRLLHLLEKLNERVDKNDEESRRRAEETQHNMDFIVQQQAQFVVDIQKLGEAQAITDGIVERLATATLGRFERVENELESKLDALIDSHVRLVDAHDRLTTSQKETDERLSAFITTVERLISARRNGESDTPEV